MAQGPFNQGNDATMYEGEINIIIVGDLIILTDPQIGQFSETTNDR